jgi:hypothetical protein
MPNDTQTAEWPILKASFRSSDERRLCQWASRRGWRRLGRDSTGHTVLEWPGNGAMVRIPSAAFGYHSAARWQARIAKMEVS